MGISSFPAITQGYDPTKLRTTDYTSSTPNFAVGYTTLLDITNSVGRIKDFFISINAAASNLGLRLTKDGEVIFDGYIAYTGSTTFQIVKPNYFLNGYSGTTVGHYSAIDGNTTIKQIDTTTKFFANNTKDNSQIATTASASTLYFLADDIFKFKQSFKIEGYASLLSSTNNVDISYETE